MRLSLDQFLNKIGVEITLRPYEAIPFDYFNMDKGLDVIAEISLSGDGRLINVEIQQIEHGEKDAMKFRQILQLQLEMESANIFMAKSLRYNGQQLAGKRRNWFEGSCRFIKQSIALIKKGTVPDFEAVYKTTLEDEGTVAGGGGSSGRNLKNDKPPPKPGQIGGKF